MCVEGFVSLTEIHKNNGGSNNSKPSLFIRTYKHLKGVEIISKAGRYGGTFASKRVADIYLKWISSNDEMFLYRVKCHKESAALDTIEQLLGVSLVRQYKVGRYRIDGYDIDSNIAYEIDECQHFRLGEIADECKNRQEIIEKVLRCKFVRIKV